MSVKIRFGFIILAILTLLGSYGYYANSSYEKRIPGKKSFRINSLKSANITDINNRVKSKRSKKIENLAESKDFLAYSYERSMDDPEKIVVNKADLNNLSFQDWLNINAAADDVTSVEEIQSATINDREASIYKYTIRLHEEQKHIVFYINFDDSVMMLGIYGSSEESFDYLEKNLWEFANEL